MPPLKPTGTTKIEVPSLGTIKGLEFEGGLSQFCGIPYAELTKRWSRSVLRTQLEGGFHDGTQHGPVTPQPPEYKGDDDMVPVPPFAHFTAPEESEFKCLSLNIVRPSANVPKPLPVMLWIHGGSFLFGAPSHPAYDMVKLVAYAKQRGTPIVAVSISYRVGLFGFLASKAIKDDLRSDGFDGVGNFGLTDQQIALAWVQRYIGCFGGDPGNVTIFGESAGGMSVAHQVWAAQPAIFRRAISMSGTLNTIPAWSLEQHEKRWEALLQHLGIDPTTPNALVQLRALPQQAIADATCPIEGAIGATGNPCDDGWYHALPPSVSSIPSPPDWLESYMVGDVKDEAMIFRLMLKDENYDTLRASMEKFLSGTETDSILSEYSIIRDDEPEVTRLRYERMAADCLFAIQNRVHAQVSQVRKTFGYHMDQVSTLDHSLKGLAFHAIDLVYVFLNLSDILTPAEQRLGDKMAADFLDFAWGNDPWDRYGENSQWMVYGPDDQWAVKREAEDETVRRYARIERIMSLGGEKFLERWVKATDFVVNKRWLLGACNH